MPRSDDRKQSDALVGERPLTLIQGALHVGDRLLGHGELEGVRSEETGGAVNQQAVDLGLAGLRLGGQVNLVQGASGGGLLSLDQGDTFGDLNVALHIVDVLEGTFLDGQRRTRDKREEMRKYRLVIELVSTGAIDVMPEKL